MEGLTELNTIKYRLIEEIIALQNKQALLKLEEEIKYLNEEENIFAKVIRPTRKTMSVDELAREQNFKGIDKEEFFAKAKALNIQESIEELLELLD